MPLPSTPLTIKGRCNCAAIRYSISIPSLPQRPLHPSSTPTDPVHLPFTAIDHCNDCRRATGATLPVWICTPIEFVTVSVVVKSKASERKGKEDGKSGNGGGKGEKEEERTEWLPASEVFKEGDISADSFLSFYWSSENRRRGFCGRCGTSLSYAALPMPEGWPDMLDIVMGTVDRGDLDSEALRPERQLWCDYGVDWIKELSVKGISDIPRHPNYKVNEVVKD